MMEQEINPCLGHDKKELQFFLSMIPPTVTQQEHKITIRNGKPVFYEPAELKAARAKIRAFLSRHKPGEPFNGAVRLTVKWIFPITGKHSHGEYKTTKPDTDNLQKMLKDIMTDLGFWKDDALVASELVEKFWGNITGIFIRVEDLSNG